MEYLHFKCKLGKESVDGFKCATAIPPKSSNPGKKNLLMSEDPLAQVIICDSTFIGKYGAKCRKI